MSCKIKVNLGKKKYSDEQKFQNQIVAFPSLDKVVTLSYNLPNAVMLTRREKEILLLLDQGLNGPKIAELLCLSTYTIETHRKNLMQKLSSNTTQMLLNKAREHSLI